MHMRQSFVCGMKVASSVKKDVRSKSYFVICTITKEVVDSYGNISVQVKGECFMKYTAYCFMKYCCMKEKVPQSF